MFLTNNVRILRKELQRFKTLRKLKILSNLILAIFLIIILGSLEI